MLILVVILSAVFVAFFLASPKAMRDRWFSRGNRVPTISTILILVFLMSLLFIYAYSGDAHNSIPSGAGVLAFGMIASTCLASIVYLQTRPVPTEKGSISVRNEDQKDVTQ